MNGMHRPVELGSLGLVGLLGLTLLSSPAIARAAEPGTALKSEHFNRDPGWEGFHNRLKPDPKDVHAVVQDFGYSQTTFAGGQKGELGGQVWRSATPAFYAAKIPVKTLND